MAKSVHFIRIKAEVLELVSQIPTGRVASYGSIGDTLEVMARNVAYILATLTDEERESVAWYRVVGDKGEAKSTRLRLASLQIALLEGEGVRVGADGKVQDFGLVKFEGLNLERGLSREG